MIDWDLPEPYDAQVVPHPSVNLVFQHQAGSAPYGELAGVGLGLFTRRLQGRGRVCGVQFRPGGAFAPGVPVSPWTGRSVPPAEVFPGHRDPAASVLAPDDENARVAALDAFLLGLGPEPDPAADRAMALVERVRTDRTVRRVDALAREQGLSVRALNGSARRTWA